ncbi:Branched-chain-amino-acid aminotransferase [Lasiodiplodia hormozganensis]|uniref:Branched-chain-amino-acid aminotransferase n=1 Tax=Lasiodiplodia hormozganensis TaxID=869390 RepID=A0AA40CGW5_9PEZI|nr:Branched-chain-amino-acid aminotransferase [Lasiodiplodia hormozganensis]
MASFTSPTSTDGPPPPITNQKNAIPAPIDATHLTHTLAPHPRPVPSAATIAASPTTICTDHMILASWNHATGWSAPALQPYAPLSLPPTASCLHYATTCFEGLKAYRGDDNRLRLFRLLRNCARLGRSAARVALPAPDPLQLAALVRALLVVDAGRWLPAASPGGDGGGRDRFLYVRPTLVGTQAQLGVQRPTEALLFIVASYMPALDAPAGGLRLQTSPANAIRAWPGGFGHAKVGANYGPTVAATQEAALQGFGQVFWLYGEEDWCTEAGGSNFFVVWRRRDGVVEVVTAPLGDGLILDGVTRGSCLELVRERLGGQVEVVERRFGIKEVVEAGEEGRLLECFVAGTAWFICAVSQIRHRGHDIHIGMGPQGNGGEITTKIKGWLSDIMYGRVEHEWAEVVPEAAKREE